MHAGQQVTYERKQRSAGRTRSSEWIPDRYFNEWNADSFAPFSIGASAWIGRKSATFALTLSDVLLTGTSQCQWFPDGPIYFRLCGRFFEAEATALISMLVAHWHYEIRLGYEAPVPTGEMEPRTVLTLRCVIFAA